MKITKEICLVKQFKKREAFASLFILLMNKYFLLGNIFTSPYSENVESILYFRLFCPNTRFQTMALNLCSSYMERIIWPISITSFLVLFYLIAVFFNFPYPLISLLFGASPIFIIWMVIRVLKDGKHSGKTWDDGFYEIDSPN
jgi:hypothetical protein